MTLKRPDLSAASEDIVAYVEALEAKLARLEGQAPPQTEAAEPEPEPSEPPTTANVIVFSAAGMVKRTPRHHYGRQRRGGMGVFDIDTPVEEPPTVLAVADESETLILFTDRGRTYRLAVQRVPESPVRARGVAVDALVPLRNGERVVAALPEGGGELVALVGERGWISTVRSSLVGRNLIPGVSYYDAEQRGPLAAACWIPGTDDDVFVATRQGQAIRFAARRVPRGGCLGIRLERDDAVVAAAPANEESGVLLLSAEGKGTIRLMEGFRANKSPGGGGKVAHKTEHLVAAAAVEEADDIFVISQQSKIIRFTAAEVPAKTGPVQGVNCMTLRADECTALAIARL